MRRKTHTKESIAVFLALVIAVTPFLVYAQQTEEAELSQAMAQAEADAATDVNSTLWLGAGCCIGIWAVLLAYAIEPSPKAARLMGKSPEYIAAYTQSYKDKAKSIQTSKAITGCIIGTVATAAAYVVLFVALAAED